VEEARNTPLSHDDFVDIAMRFETNRIVFDRLKTLKLDQCYLAAGSLFQVIWNAQSGQTLGSGIKDLDVFYFDDTDLSWEAENAVIERAKVLFHDIEMSVDIKNQARVHLWYKERFGFDMEPLVSSKAGIESFLIACTCVGIDCATGELYAPDGLGDLQAGQLRMNPRNPKPSLFLEKAADYKSRWPWLTIVSKEAAL